MEVFSDRGSTPLASTKGVLHEHLLFSRRFRRDGVVVIPTTRNTQSILMVDWVFLLFDCMTTF